MKEVASSKNKAPDLGTSVEAPNLGAAHSVHAFEVREERPDLGVVEEPLMGTAHSVHASEVREEAPDLGIMEAPLMGAGGVVALAGRVGGAPMALGATAKSRGANAGKPYLR
ncbi:unnamed protein product [Ilex paraguariensis]|uniref:Uncharacterized protein n=1 Tax=Ilex paraguariensis TaxID=185542 RepID=A0ABC8REN7_9AQUA